MSATSSGKQINENTLSAISNQPSKHIRSSDVVLNGSPRAKYSTMQEYIEKHPTWSPRTKKIKIQKSLKHVEPETPQIYNEYSHFPHFTRKKKIFFTKRTCI